MKNYAVYLGVKSLLGVRFETLEPSTEQHDQDPGKGAQAVIVGNAPGGLPAGDGAAEPGEQVAAGDGAVEGDLAGWLLSS